MKTLKQAAEEWMHESDDDNGIPVTSWAWSDVIEAFKGGAEWQKKQFSDILDKWEEHAIRGMRLGASAYHQGKIALICDLQDWIKEQTKK